MNLYLVSQDIKNRYDIYDSVVVAAETASDALDIHPSPNIQVLDGVWKWAYKGKSYVQGDFAWLPYSDIYLLEVKYIGETTEERGVILASFNAG
jgi:hypothetical protein